MHLLTTTAWSYGRSAVLASSCLVSLLLGGCQTGHYRADALPPGLAAAAPTTTRNLQLANLAASGQNSTRIAAGDLLEVHVETGAETAPSKPHLTRVGEDGAIQLPAIGAVALGGQLPADAGRAIAAAAVDRGVYRQPQVTVSVKQQATNQIMVLGAVKNPGAHQLPKNSSDILSALAAAGGLTDEAGLEVEVLRQDGRRLADASGEQPGKDAPVQQVSYNQGGYPVGPAVERIDLAAANPQASGRVLDDHDVVMVTPKEKRVFHVTGLVKRPDQFELVDDQPTRLLDAVAMAGGATSTVADKVIVLRQTPEGGAPVVIEASMRRAKRDGRENLALAAGDLVSVESTVATTTLETLKNFFRVTMGVSSGLTAF